MAIIERSATDLARAIRDGALSSRKVVEAHIAQARRLNPTLQAIAESGIPVEFNTSGWRKGSAEPYPAAWILARCRDLGIPIIVTADAHAPDQVTWGYDRAISCLDDLTITPQQSIEMAGV